MPLQALGQSEAFLSTHLPHARREECPSTAGAALSLLEDTGGEEGEGAAICSSAVLELHPELEVLSKGIQSISGKLFVSRSSIKAH